MAGHDGVWVRVPLPHVLMDGRRGGLVEEKKDKELMAIYY